MNAKERFVDSAFDVLGRIEVVLTRLSHKEFSSTVAYDLYGSVRDIKFAGVSFSYNDVVDALWLMEKLLLSIRTNAIKYDMDMVDCFIEFSNCVSELVSDTFDDEIIVDDYYVNDALIGCMPRQM